LHALRLEFLHPVRLEQTIVSALPPATFPWNLFKQKTSSLVSES
jgi:hypothetical protein